MSLHGWPVYVVVSFPAFGASAIFLGMVLPGETAMVVAGGLAARGNIPLLAVIAVCSSATVLGDQVGYLVGRRRRGGGPESAAPQACVGGPQYRVGRRHSLRNFSASVS